MKRKIFTFVMLVLMSGIAFGEYAGGPYGRLHMSYIDSTNGYLKHAQYDGTNWTTEIVDDSGNVGYYTSIKQAPSSGNLHIAYYDTTNDYLKHAVYDGSNWTTETVDNSGMVSGCKFPIAVSSDEKLYISYGALTGGGDYESDLYCAKYDGCWSTSIVKQHESSRDGPFDLYIALDPSENPIIAYQYNEYWSGASLRFAQWNGTTWQHTTIDPGGSNENAGGHCCLIVGLDGRFHISHFDYNHDNLKYAVYNGTNWTEYDSIAASDTGQTSITETSDGHLHISYIHTGALRHAEYDGSIWSTEIVDDFTIVANTTCIINSPDEHLHISYYDSTNQRLKHAEYNGSSWTTEIIDSSSDVGKGSSIIYTPQQVCQYVLVGDLNDDCKVDFYDFAMMAENWLIDCCLDPNNPACVPK